MKELIRELVRDSKIAPHVVYRGLAEGRAARFAEPRDGWPQGAKDAAAALGVRRLWSHQAEALDCVASGANALLATPTASGKTLAYLLGFLARRAVDPEARAVFVYPLKALARDQLATIRRALEPLGLDATEAADVYDGDTPEALRRRIRRSPPAVIVTNPDMLHLGIVPSHDTWSAFLGRLALVVVDEAHVYRGIFGAHVHHVLRRLLRVARLHGADPRVLAGSATIGAPEAFIETLVGERFTVIADAGAPASPRHVLFLTPEFASPYTVATHVLGRSVAQAHKTIVFTKARRITELLQQWVREQYPRLAPRIASYRSGYLPEERRAIEARLFRGDLDGVISTSALEAGIDVGGLDVCVLVGYPGSLATAWQRIGRTGRQDRESLAVLVAMPDALDRYVAAHPEHFFSGAFERVVLDPRNDAVADAHLVAAGAERSLDRADLVQLQGPEGPARAARLVESGALVLAHEDERWFSLRRKPQRDIPLRSTGQPYTLRLSGTGQVLGTLDAGRAWFEGHPGAIYLHAGQTFRALALDDSDHVVTLEPVTADYFTQVYAGKETEILEELARRSFGPGELVLGRVRVTTTIDSYAKRRLFTQEEISRHPVEDAPPQVMETVAFWVVFPQGTLETLVASDLHPVGSLHALEHAAIGLFPLLAICDRWDLGGISYAHHPQVQRPAVFVYDGYAGGVGLARTGFERAEELFARTLDLVRGCSCEIGCPACIISPKCGAGNHPLDKAGAIAVLEILAGQRELAAPDELVRAEAPLERALASHRTRVHAGVHGGGAAAKELGAVAITDGEPGALVTLDTAAWPVDLARPRELLAAHEGRWLFFDVETLRSAEDVGGWDHIDKMGLALAVVLDAASGEFRTYRQGDALALADDLAAADRVVGFNLDRFDITVLRGEAGAAAVAGIRTLDLLRVIHEKIGRRLRLSHLAQATLGVDKSADGLQSLEWVREGRFDLIEKYCRDDVLLTAALWAYGRQQGYVLFRNRDGILGRIPVKW